jgi:hypothetical protein
LDQNKIDRKFLNQRNTQTAKKKDTNRMTTMEEIMKTKAIELIHQFGSPSQIRDRVKNKTPTQLSRLLNGRFRHAIEYGMSGLLTGNTEYDSGPNGEDIGHYDLTESQREELTNQWDQDWDEEPLSDFQLVTHFQDAMLYRFEDEWFEYFKTYMNSDEQA